MKRINEKESKRVLSCSVVGARGYAGLELVRILLAHPEAKLTHCFATSEFSLMDLVGNPLAAKVTCLPDSQIFEHLTDVVFLATPAEVSLRLAPKILSAGRRVIDLSGAFRLKQNDYSKWYGFEHSELALAKVADYGLSPWAGPSPRSNLVANPGCYATAILLALLPLLKQGVIEQTGLVIDAKSGATGAGKKASENLLFTEVEGECLPYKIGKHQHFPEIEEALIGWAGIERFDAHLATSLLPIRRGIVAGIHARTAPGRGLEDVVRAYDEAYEGYSLFAHGHLRSRPALAQLKRVVGTGKTHVTYELDGNRLYVFSCIDNLLKGAASQAVENFNRLSDLPLDTGLGRLEAVT